VPTVNGSLFLNARIISLHHAGEASNLPRRGLALRDLAIIDRGYVRIVDGRIAEVSPGAPQRVHDGEHVIDAQGRVLMPGFVDCHTHACWAGERIDEWEMKLAGRSYLDILNAGGGIMSTVRCVRATATATLADELLRRLRQMAAYGTTTAEVKSGYGLDLDTEMRMLDAITLAAQRSALRVVPTFLGAHAIDPENPACVEQMIDDALPAVARKYPGLTVDAYCESGAWSLEQCNRYFVQAKKLGLGVRVHTDQFNALGMIPAALALGAKSVDHLECASDHDLQLVARSSTIAVGLPVTSFCLGNPFIRARQFIDAGGALALATNANPGSAPVRGMPIVLSFAVREMRMTPAEAITATTWNAACVVGAAHECGSIAIGKSADLVLWPCTDERALGYEISGPLPEVVMARGVIL